MVEKILQALNKLPYDKALHMSYGALLFVVILFFTLLLGLYWVVALYVVVIAAVSKEVYDFFHKNLHTVDFLDFIATIIIPLLLSIYLCFKL